MEPVGIPTETELGVVSTLYSPAKSPKTKDLELKSESHKLRIEHSRKLKGPGLWTAFITTASTE